MPGPSDTGPKARLCTRRRCLVSHEASNRGAKLDVSPGVARSRAHPGRAVRVLEGVQSIGSAWRRGGQGAVGALYQPVAFEFPGRPHVVAGQFREIDVLQQDGVQPANLDLHREGGGSVFKPALVAEWDARSWLNSPITPTEIERVPSGWKPPCAALLGQL